MSAALASGKNWPEFRLGRERHRCPFIFSYIHKLLEGCGLSLRKPLSRATHVARAALGMVSSQRSLQLSTSLFTKEMIVALFVGLVAQCSNLITFCVTSLYPQHRVRIAAMREAQPVLVQLSETGNPYFVLLARNLIPGLLHCWSPVQCRLTGSHSDVPK